MVYVCMYCRAQNGGPVQIFQIPLDKLCLTCSYLVINWLSVEIKYSRQRSKFLAVQYRNLGVILNQYRKQRSLVYRRWTTESTHSYRVQDGKNGLPFLLINSCPSDLWPSTLWPGHNYCCTGHLVSHKTTFWCHLLAIVPTCCTQVFS